MVNHMTIKTIGVIGAGTMGSGVALVALYADYDVILQDISLDTLEKARAYLEKFLTKKRLGPPDGTSYLHRQAHRFGSNGQCNRSRDRESRNKTRSFLSSGVNLFC